jgi:hypothetical protein
MDTSNNTKNYIIHKGTHWDADFTRYWAMHKYKNVILSGNLHHTSIRPLTYITLQSGHSALCKEVQCSSLFQCVVWQYPHTSVQSTEVNTRFLNLMFYSLCIVICQYSRTNKMHLVFSLLWTNSLYMFRALLDHLQEVLHKQQMVYCMCIM